MSSIFKRRSRVAIEEFDGEVIEGVEETIAPEEVVVGNDSEEIISEADDNSEFAEGISDVTENVEDLEVLRDNLEADLADEETPAPTEAAMEAWQVAVNMVERQFGNRDGLVIAGLAAESFAGSDAERRHNARLALEALSDTIRSWWDKIKTMLKNLWTSIKDFWNKHISTLGRLKKALESAKKKVKGKLGAPDTSKTVKAPGALQKAIAKKSGSISTADFTALLTRHAAAYKVAEEFMRKGKEVMNKVDTAAETNAKNVKGNDDVSIQARIANQKNLVPEAIGNNIVFAKEGEALVGGWYGSINVDDYDKGGEDSYKIEFKQDRTDVEFDKDQDIKAAGKTDLEGLLTKAITLIDYTMDLGKDFKEVDKNFEKHLTSITNSLEKASDEAATLVRANAASFRKISDFLPKVNQRIASLNVSLAKAVLTYTSLSLSTYSK